MIRLKKAFFTLIFLSAILRGVCFAGTMNLEGVASFIQTPQGLVNWLVKDFRYELEMPDYWQSAEETLRLKKGDCDDFAILASAILSKMNLPNDIVIVTFKGLNISHALCVWKDKDGLYSFISNQKLYETKEAQLEVAIARFYPDWEKITYTDQNKHYKKVVSRSQQKQGRHQDLETASPGN